MTTLALVLLLIAVVGLAVAATVGFLHGGLPAATPDVPPPLDAAVAVPGDLDRARFGLAFRGYRMDQVDVVLDGARDALAARDQEIARLREVLDPAPADESPAAAEPVVEEPVVEEPVVEEPVAAVPVAPVPVADEPVAEHSPGDETEAVAPDVNEPADTTDDTLDENPVDTTADAADSSRV